MNNNAVFYRDEQGVWHVTVKENDQIKEWKHTSRSKAIASFFHTHPRITQFVIGVPDKATLGK